MLREAGVPEDQIVAARRADDDAEPVAATVLWAWHMDAAAICSAMVRRWIVLAGPTGQVLYRGWDMTALREVRAWLRIRPTRKLWGQISIMERESLRVLNG